MQNAINIREVMGKLLLIESLVNCGLKRLRDLLNLNEAIRLNINNKSKNTNHYMLEHL